MRKLPWPSWTMLGMSLPTCPQKWLQGAVGLLLLNVLLAVDISLVGCVHADSVTLSETSFSQHHWRHISILWTRCSSFPPSPLPRQPKSHLLCCLRVWQVSTATDGYAMLSTRKQAALRLILRTADVCHCARPFAVSKLWSNRMTAEYFQQGDQERLRSIPPSWFMNREDPRVDECQIVFMTYIALPVLRVTGSLFPMFRDMFEAGLDENRRSVPHPAVV